MDASEGGSTHESMLAAGPDYLLHFTPQWVDFYDKSPTPVLQASHPINTFFAPAPNGTSGDPVAFYDVFHGRYLMFVMGGTDEVKLWISKGGLDPTQAANWWKYVLPAPERDYVGLGVSDDKISLIWNGPSGPELRILDRAQAYDSTYASGEPIAYDVSLSAGGKVCRNLTADPTLYLVRRSGANIGLRTITGPASACSVSAEILIPIPADPPNTARAEQPDTTAFNSCEPRYLDYLYPQSEVYMRNGRIAMAWTNTSSYGEGSPPVKAIRCVRFQIAGGVVLDDFQVGRAGMHYTFPSVVEDARGTLFVGYDRFSPNEFPSCYMLARSGSHQSPEFLVQAGNATYMGCVRGKNKCNEGPAGRWGDYTSMIVDEFACGASHTTARFAGGWTQDALLHGTDNAIGTMVADYGTATISGAVQSDDNGLRSARAGAPVVLRVSGVPVDSTTTDSTGAFQFGLLPDGTYHLRLAWPDSVALLAIPGSGGVSQIPLCATEIEIVVTSGQTSSGNQFVVREQPAPAITSLSATSVNHTDPDFDLVVTGQGFRPWSTVMVDGRPKAATFDPLAGTFTARVQHYDVARSGIHSVAVLTPGAPGTGASPALNLVSLPSYVASVTSPAIVSACPAGDGGRLVVTVVAQSSPVCNFSAQSATSTLMLFSSDQPELMIWDADQPAPPFPYFTATSAGVYDPGTDTKTFTFDFGKISACGHLAVSLSVGGQPVPVPTIEIRSMDLDGLAYGSVDRFDFDVFSGLFGGTEPCGDFVPSGWVDSSDLAYFGLHYGHTAHIRHVISPDGGETYARSSGSHPTIPIRWDTGCNGVPCGDSARVTINLLDGANVTPVASDLVDNGAYDWSTYCGVPASSNKKIEVIHTAGVLRPGDVTIGTDQSDGPFTISGSCGGGGGCPYLDTWVAGGWREENSILGRSLTGEIQSDLYRLTQVPDLGADHTVRLRLREDEHERTRLASAGLLAVDRNPDQTSWAMDGRVLVGTRVPVARVLTSTGEDLTRLLSDPNGSGYEGKPGTVLRVELWDEADDPTVTPDQRGGVLVLASRKEIDSPPGTGARQVAAGDAEVLSRTGIVLQVPNATGSWNEARRWYPRARSAELAAASGREVRLVFVGRHRIHGIQWMRTDAESPAAVGAAPTGAVHSELGDVGPWLAGRGAEEVTLSPGENLSLTFRVSPVPEGRVRDYYFAARGVYTTLSEPAPAPDTELPVALQLLPARPNPTGGTVSFAFELPTRARVGLSVFDAQGRLVTRVVNGTTEAGRHLATWDLAGRSGKRVSPGIYFYRMEVGSWRQERKLVVR